MDKAKKATKIKINTITSCKIHVDPIACLISSPTNTKYEGVNSGENGSISIINNYLKYNSYGTKGTCENEGFGATSLDSNTLVEADEKTKYYYCVKKVNTSNLTFEDRASYEIETFFKFNLPLLGDIFTFRVTGKTIDINWPDDDIHYSVD